MTASDRADAFTTLLNALRKKYKPEPAPDRTAIEELIHAMLLWESTTARADRAYKRLMDAFVDLNEMRVSRPDEIAELLGKTYPLADERSRRLLGSLNAIYLIEHAVSLDAIVAAGKRDARKYLDAIEALPPFAAARVAALRFDGHAVPLEPRTVEALVAASVLEEGTDLARAVGQIERIVKASESQEVTLLFQAWTDDNLPALTKAARKPAGKPAAKSKPAAAAEPKAAAKKATTKKTTAKKVTKKASTKGH